VSSQIKLIAISQLSILVFALVLSLAPQLYLALVLAYIFGMGAITAIQQRRFARSAKLDDVLSGRKLFEEQKAMDIAVADEELARELTGQVKMLVASFLGLGVAVGIFAAISLVRGQVVQGFTALTGSEKLANFLYWLLLFEILFIASRAATLLVAKGAQKQQPPLIPSRYVVTDRGVAVPGVIGLALAFPLPSGYEVRVNEKRKFVEIADSRGRRLRLYTRNPRRLYELILNLNRRAAERTQVRG
jgi:uncharacterized membrane protein